MPRHSVPTVEAVCPGVRPWDHTLPWPGPCPGGLRPPQPIRLPRQGARAGRSPAVWGQPGHPPPQLHRHRHRQGSRWEEKGQRGAAESGGKERGERSEHSSPMAPQSQPTRSPRREGSQFPETQERVGPHRLGDRDRGAGRAAGDPSALHRPSFPSTGSGRSPAGLFPTPVGQGTQLRVTEFAPKSHSCEVTGRGDCPAHAGKAAATPAKRQRGHLTSSHNLVASRCLRAQSLFLWSPVQLGRLPAPGAPGSGGQVLQGAERLLFRLRLVPLGLWEAGAVPLTPRRSSPGRAWVPGVRGGTSDRQCGRQVVLGLPGSLGSPGVT